MQELSVKITSAGRKYLSMYYDDPASGKRITDSTAPPFAGKRRRPPASGKPN